MAIKVEPSGVVFGAQCHVQTARCVAREWGGLTAVWGPPGQTQINVCGACPDEKVFTGEWHIPGARARLPELAGPIAAPSSGADPGSG